ncbi:hypothetical protein ISS03_05055 [Patescibacteria group bacterium]|nr:hypothetical protein [Patescibacteria group bacterium]
MPYYNLVQGFFFQPNQFLELDNESGESVAVVNENTIRFMYAGTIYPNKNKPTSELIGGMNDHFGYSLLSNVHVSEQELRFVKKYTDRKDTIQYEFIRQDDGAWIGSYSGIYVGRGSAKCILTEVQKSFFLPPNKRRIINKKSSNVLHGGAPK